MDIVQLMHSIVFVMLLEIIYGQQYLFRQIADCKYTSEYPSAEEKRRKVTKGYSLPNISAYEVFFTYSFFYAILRIFWCL